ncbi:hypothetical protein Q5Z34_15920 [Listeria innocua]
MRRFAINGYGEAQDVFEEIDAHPRKVDSGHIRVEIKAFSEHEKRKSHQFRYFASNRTNGTL